MRKQQKVTESFVRILIVYQISKCLYKFTAGIFRKRIIKAAFQDIHRPIIVCEKHYREPWKRRSSDDQRSIADQSSWYQRQTCRQPRKQQTSKQLTSNQGNKQVSLSNLHLNTVKNSSAKTDY